MAAASPAAATARFLTPLVRGDVRLRATADGLWSALPPDAEGASYDRLARAYDWVIGNPLYNRIVWRSRTGDYTDAARAVVAGVPAGPLLDCGCGTLVFTAPAYRAGPIDRIVLLDRSLAMLRRARDRVAGGHFLQGDALDLPFPGATFAAVMSWGMLHVFGTRSPFLGELARVAAPGATVAISSLVSTGSGIGDRMLAALRARGEIADPEDAATVHAAFAARFDAVAAARAGNMLLLTGRARAMDPHGDGGVLGA